MSRSKLFALVAAVGLALTGVGAAPTSADDSSWYLDAKVGQSSYRARVADGLWSFDDDGRSATFEVGYALNPYLAFEAAYHDLGTFEGSGSACPRSAPVCIALQAAVEADVSGLSLAAVPRYPINDRFSVYGKVGVIDWSSDISLAGGRFSGGRLDSLSGQDLLVAAGGRYDFRNGFGVALEHQELDFDARSTSLGLSYRF